MPYLSIFHQKSLILVFLGKKLKKTIVIFEISTLKLLSLQNLFKKQKRLNIRQKLSDFGILGLELENSTVMFEISNLEFV